ncbi:nitronate monooxygenase [Alicyclobacillus cellulosilyticus]|uniref:Probable nitronate monooxygenase n=1 Tax=Alicyclobacillus cellulosilyticus TaxID=1003997 RepID=A0A917K807_9BACL|nr:nitronate monooxygenase [Alicyclobacillus cellulosilyticus]GGJ03315.1 nitronate monooxygenase [Alicyclobacillus cellulosilyticus]
MLQTRFTELVQIRYPIVQAGMAGGITTPELVAAVSNAGGLGTIGAGYMAPDDLRTAIRQVKRLTNCPFAVNLFVETETVASDDEIAQMNRYLDQIRAHLGLGPSPKLDQYTQSFADQIQVVLDECVPVFSFTFGIPPRDVIAQLKQRGIVVIGTATTVNEAIELEAAGVDAVVAQGSEAGGHRGTFLSDVSRSLIGTMALVPQVVDHVSVPVIASGGIMDGRGLIACFALGASAVQMGTAFLACPESGAHALYKQRVLNSTEDATEITWAYSGKAARGIRTQFMERMKGYPGNIPPYPVQNALTQDIRRAAAKQNNPEYMSLWAGQGLRLATRRSAAAVIRDTVEQGLVALHQMTSFKR